MGDLFPVEQLDIEVSNQELNFVAVGEKEQLVVFEELDDFDDADGFLPQLIVLKPIDAFDRVHGVGVFGEQIPHGFMVFPK